MSGKKPADGWELEKKRRTSLSSCDRCAWALSWIDMVEDQVVAAGCKFGDGYGCAGVLLVMVIRCVGECVFVGGKRKRGQFDCGTWMQVGRSVIAKPVDTSRFHKPDSGPEDMRHARTS